MSSTSVTESCGAGPFIHSCMYVVTRLRTSILFRISRMVGLSDGLTESILPIRSLSPLL